VKLAQYTIGTITTTTTTITIAGIITTITIIIIAGITTTIIITTTTMTGTRTDRRAAQPREPGAGLPTQR